MGRKEGRMSESLLGIVCLSIHPGLAPTLGAGAIPTQMGLVMTIHTSPLASCCHSTKHNLVAWHLRCFHIELQHNFPVLFPFFILMFILKVICTYISNIWIYFPRENLKQWNRGKFKVWYFLFVPFPILISGAFLEVILQSVCYESFLSHMSRLYDLWIYLKSV